MSDISDLPYVRGEDRNVPSTPVVEVNLGNWFDASGTLGAAGVAIDLFEPHLGFTVLSRNIQNINEEGNIWINIFGDDAGIATPGSYKIPPGAMFDIPTRGRVSICGDLPDLKFTAGEA